MNRTKTSALTLAVFLLLAATAAPQTPPPPVKADIPFQFYAAGKSMPAGSHQILKHAVASVGGAVRTVQDAGARRDASAG